MALGWNKKKRRRKKTIEWWIDERMGTWIDGWVGMWVVTWIDLCQNLDLFCLVLQSVSCHRSSKYVTLPSLNHLIPNQKVTVYLSKL